MTEVCFIMGIKVRASDGIKLLLYEAVTLLPK